MPLPATKVFLFSAASGTGGYRLTENDPGDLGFSVTGYPSSAWLTTIGDLNGDGVAEIVAAATGSSDQEIGGGRIEVEFGLSTGGPVGKLGDSVLSFHIDGAAINDHIGAALAAIGDQDGDALPDLLIGAPLADPGGLGAAGAAYVVWQIAEGDSVDLADLYVPESEKGYAIFGEAAGDHAGHAVAGIADLNGDGRADIVVGAPNSDAGGAGSGAAYVVWGKATDTPVELSDVAAGIGGFRITGAAGDAAGSALLSVADLNGDGKAEIVVGASGSDAGGVDAGAVYVVFGKSSTTEVDLVDVGAGLGGGFRITGAAAGEKVGTVLAGLGDINGDGVGDLLLGAVNKAYVVFGKANSAEVDLADVATGVGGFVILPEAAGDLSNLSVAGGADLNRDGILDIVIGASHNAEGGFNAGAVYVVWGGGTGTVDLSAIAMGAGGAKVVGSSGSLTGSSIAIAPDMNGDGTADLVIGSPGGGNASVSVLYAPASWQPDPNAYGSNGADTLGAGDGGANPIGEGNDSIFALGGADSVSAGGGDDLVDGGAGADTLAGGAGNDLYVLDAATDVVVEATGEGADTVESSASFVLPEEVEVLRLTAANRIGTGNTAANLLLGSTGADTLRGMAGADTLAGDSGNDSLDGGSGADSMNGGAGNDSYAIDDLGDLVTDSAGADTVVASIDYTALADIEVLALTGAAHSGTGNALNNIIVGGTGADSLFGLDGADSLLGNGDADLLDGGLGADTMVGGAGNDFYLVDNAGDRTTEVGLGGADTVAAMVDHTLATEMEALVLAAAGLRGTGNGLANRLVGNSGAETLDGGLGADTLEGGAGNDVYVVDQLGDVIIEGVGGGHDLVRSAFSYALGGTEIEDLVLTGVNLAGTGNAEANAITGGTGADTLDGGAGADTLTGGAGNDLYVVDDAGDVVTDTAGADTVLSSVDATISDGVEALLLTGGAHHATGNAGDNLLRGGAGEDSLEGLLGADTLDGGAGADTMAGGDGDDTYFITDPGDVVVEGVGGGIDTVIVSTDWTLAAGAGVENVQLIGAGRQVTGNAEANTLSGNSGDDTLDGAEGDDLELGGDGDDELHSHSGHDTLSGGSGNDHYIVHGGGVHIEDFLGEDTLDSSESIDDDYIDLSDGGPSTIGGHECDFGQGGTASGPLDLQFLQDLTGSFGDDIANVRNLVPQIVLALQAVQPNSTFGASSFRDKAFGSFGNVGDWVYRQEVGLSTDTAALTAAYTAMAAGGGADGPEAQIEALMQLSLHAGDVGFRLNSARFVVLFTDADYHVAGQGLAAGIPLPNNGDGILDGSPAGTGEDYPAIAQLKAAIEAANIIPIFAVAGGFAVPYGDLVTQLGRGAYVTLTADSSNVVAAITAGLNAVTRTSIEDAWGGHGADTIRGNIGDNRLEGRDGNDSLYGDDGHDGLAGGIGHDRLDGGAGGDTMEGGSGNDTYVVEDAADGIVEAAAGTGGRDTVEAHRDWTLAAGLEGLKLFGAATHGIGNAAANRLEAGAGGVWLEGLGGIDVLVGGAGGDTLDGGTGADRLAGGLGNDLYLVDDVGDLITESGSRTAGADTVDAALDWTLGTGLEGLALRGTATHGTGNALANTMQANALGNRLEGLAGNDILNGGLGADTLDGGAGVDRMAGGGGNDIYLVDDTRDVVTEAVGGGIDTVLTSVSHTLRTGVEVLQLRGAALNGTGSIDANEIVGNALDNLLLGMRGADTLNGGDGADTLNGGAQADRLSGGTGADLFLFGGLADRSDTVTDFTAGEDAIAVSAGGFGGGLLAGADLAAENRFVTGLVATEAFGQFLWDAALARLSFDADGTGLGAKLLIASFAPGVVLTATDLQVIA